MNTKWVLVYEHISKPVKVVSSDKNDYILEGVFAEFDITNENGRIYREKEYLPHLTYLLEKVKNKTLFGELDHPLDRFDVVLSNVSHIVESIEYDSKNKIIKGRIKLLDTVAGKNAKAIIDGGGTLSISSRAAGMVKENGEVEIKRIFAYDLVAEPGFKSAKLRRLNEELNILNDKFLILEYNDNNLAVYCDEGGCSLVNNVDEYNMSNIDNLIANESLNKNNNIDYGILNEINSIKEFLGINEKKYDSFYNMVNEISYENIKDFRDQFLDMRAKLYKIEKVLESYDDEMNRKFNLKYKMGVKKLADELNERIEIINNKINRNNRKYYDKYEKIEMMLDKYNKDIVELKRLFTSINNKLKIYALNYDNVRNLLDRIKKRIYKMENDISRKILNMKGEIGNNVEKLKDITNKVNDLSLDTKNIKKFVNKGNFDYGKTVLRNKRAKYPMINRLDVKSVVKRVDEALKEAEFDEFIDKDTKKKLKAIYEKLSDDQKKKLNSLPVGKKLDVINNLILESPITGGDNINEGLRISDYSLYIPNDLVPIWEELNTDEKEKLLKILESRKYTTAIEVEDFWKNVLTAYKEKEEILEDLDLRSLNLNEDYLLSLINTIKQNTQ